MSIMSKTFLPSCLSHNTHAQPFPSYNLASMLFPPSFWLHSNAIGSLWIQDHQQLLMNIFLVGESWLLNDVLGVGSAVPPTLPPSSEVGLFCWVIQSWCYPNALHQPTLLCKISTPLMLIHGLLKSQPLDIANVAAACWAPVRHGRHQCTMFLLPKLVGGREVHTCFGPCPVFSPISQSSPNTFYSIFFTPWHVQMTLMGAPGVLTPNPSVPVSVFALDVTGLAEYSRWKA